jgi:CheY-like chemotaxis protein
MMTWPEPIRVLLVDDEAALRRSIRRAIAHTFEIVEAEDGAEAIALVRAQRFDAVVTDLAMPNVDGAALVTWIQRYQPDLAARVLVLTGGPSSASQRKWLDAFPEDRVLVKPCTAKILVEALQRVVARGGP